MPEPDSWFPGDSFIPAGNELFPGDSFFPGDTFFNPGTGIVIGTTGTDTSQMDAGRADLLESGGGVLIPDGTTG